jgi:outer membrane protein TolC
MPQPGLDPTRAAGEYSARRLDDSAVTALLGRAGDPPTDSGWDETQLALVALHFRGELPAALATVAEARAGERTAGVGVPVGVDGSVTRTARPVETATSPWTETLSATLTIELGGKRAARRARARAATLAARLRAEATAWQIAGDTRRAVVDARAADLAVADARAETDALRALAALLHGRYREGSLSTVDVARADADAQTAAVGVVDAERARTDARLTLARAAAVAYDRVDTLRLRATEPSSCDLVDTLDRTSARRVRDSLAVVALRGRPDVGAALADYAAAEADVRLAVARQYPDLTIGPGILWDEGIPGWVLGVGLPSRGSARQRGPIAEAEAVRAEVAARARLLQDSVMAAIDSSVVACRGVRGGARSADSLVVVMQRQLDAVSAAYDRGEIGRTEIAIAELALIRARQTARVAAARGAGAGAALDRAVGRWARLASRVWLAGVAP